MYVNPIVVGVLATLGVELLLIIVVGIAHSNKPQFHFDDPRERSITTNISPEELPEVIDLLSRLNQKRRENESNSNQGEQ